MPDPTPPQLGTTGNSLAADQSGNSWLASTWLEQLQPGSWRGVGFVMDSAETHAGRRTATHEYPYRDTVWVEDLGRLPRRFTFTAFLVGDDVYQQRNAMIQACEQPGEGTLVHPTLGSVQCVLIDFTTSDRRERGRYVEISFSFVVSGDLLFPTAALATGPAVNNAAAALNTASASDLSSSLSSLPQVPQIGTQAVPGFGTLATAAVNDPTRALSAVAGLQGYYGRYSAGSRSTLQDPSATVASCLAQAVTSRETVLAAVATLNAAAIAL